MFYSEFCSCNPCDKWCVVAQKAKNINMVARLIETRKHFNLGDHLRPNSRLNSLGPLKHISTEDKEEKTASRENAIESFEILESGSVACTAVLHNVLFFFFYFRLKTIIKFVFSLLVSVTYSNKRP